MENRNDSQPRILPEEVVGRMLAAPDPGTPEGRRDRALLCLLSDAGLKAQEVSCLRREDLDLRISCVQVRSGKEGEEARLVPFGDSTRKALLSYLQDCSAQPAGPGPLLFPGRGGGPLTRQAVWKKVRKYGEAAGAGRPVSPEDLRAFFAVSLLARGADPEGVRQMLGIRQAAMKRYLGCVKGDSPAAVLRRSRKGGALSPPQTS